MPKIDKLSANLYKKLISIIKEKEIKCAFEKIEKAFYFAFEAHDGQLRGSGEPYITHPLEVAIIIAKYGADEKSIISAFLHDCVEDCDISLEQIENNFGKKVANIVDGLTKIDELICENSSNIYENLKLKDIETIRKIFEKTEKDTRIILIKIADRLHNMRTLSGMKSEKSKLKKANETMYIFIKIAEKLGLIEIKNEFFDICFSYIDKEKHSQIKNFLKNNEKEKEEILSKIIENLKKKDEKNKIKEIFSHKKSIKSLSLVLKNKGELTTNDNLILNIIIENKNDFKDISKIIKSYFDLEIKNIKKEESYESSSNGPYYQYYCLDIIDKNGKIIQFRIMTKEMMNSNKIGIFSTFFKEKEDLKIDLFDNFAEINEATKGNSADFYDATRSDLLESKIKIHNNGELLEVVNNSTALDAVFNIFGKKALNTKEIFINDKKVFFDKIIKNNDFIKVNFSNQKKATFKWFYLIKKFKSRILMQEFLKNKNQNKKIEEGKILLQKEFDFYGKGNIDNILQSNFEILQNNFGINTFDDLFILIYEGRIKIYNIFKDCFPDEKPGFFNKYIKKIDIFLEKIFLCQKGKSFFGIKIKGILDKKTKTLSFLTKNSNDFSVDLDSLKIKTDKKNNIFNIIINGKSNDEKKMHNFFIKISNQSEVIDVIPIISQRNQLLAFFWFSFSIIMAFLLPFFLKYIENIGYLSEYLKNIAIYSALIPVFISNYIFFSFVKNYFSQLRNTKIINFGYLFLNFIIFGFFINTAINYSGFYFSLPVIISVFLIISMLSLIKLLPKNIKSEKLQKISKEEWEEKKKQKSIGYIIRFFAVIVWGIQPLFIKYTPANEVDPFLRIFFTGIGGIIPPLLAFIFIYFFVDKAIKKVKLKYNTTFFTIVFGYISFTYLLSLSLMHTTSTNVILINNFAPVLSIILAVLIWRNEIPYLKDKKNILIIFLIFIIGSIGSSLLFYNDLKNGTQENLFGDFMGILLMVADVILVVALIRYAKTFKGNESSILNININLAIIIASVPLIFWKFDIFKFLPFEQILFSIGAGFLSGIGQLLNLEAFKRIDGFLAFLMFNIAILITFIGEVYFLKQTEVSLIIIFSGILIMGASIGAEFLNTKCEKEALE